MKTFPQLLVIPVQNQDELDALVTGLDNLTTLTESLKPILDRASLRLADRSKESRVVISGEVVASGPLNDMQKRYESEAAMNPKSAVALQEWSDGSYRVKQGRKQQRLTNPHI